MQCETNQGKTIHGRTGHNKTRQNKTRQDKTRPVKTRRVKTTQDKTIQEKDGDKEKTETKTDRWAEERIVRVRHAFNQRPHFQHISKYRQRVTNRRKTSLSTGSLWGGPVAESRFARDRQTQTHTD